MINNENSFTTRNQDLRFFVHIEIEDDDEALQNTNSLELLESFFVVNEQLLCVVGNPKPSNDLFSRI